ncbi:MAG TPA: hypothetical protein VFT74_05455, partial [Isosphaeraceae bacterium]|nr:hypothetical protein [Isosphaeraceae bacterium]
VAALARARSLVVYDSRASKNVTVFGASFQFGSVQDALEFEERVTTEMALAMDDHALEHEDTGFPIQVDTAKQDEDDDKTGP